jgi:hypothetical protein
MCSTDELIKANERISELEIKNESLKKQLNEIKERNKRESNENICNERLKQSLKRFLGDNQIEYLIHGNSRTFSFSDETVQKSLALLQKAGKKCYEFIRTQGYPIPFYSILMRRLQNISFDSGIQEELIKIASTSIQEDIVHCS